MANLKGVKIKDLNPAKRKPYGVYSRYGEYFNLLLNSVEIIDKTTGAPLEFAVEKFVKTGLFEGGAMGYDKLTKRWFYVYGEGLNELGNPTRLIFVTANGKTFTRNSSWDKSPNGAYIIYALPFNMSMSELIRETTDFMTNCDVAMRQNLEACKTPYIVVCKDDNMRLSFEQAIQQKQQGQAVVVVSPDLGDGLKAVNIGVDYLVDRFAEARDMERNTLLNKLGIMTANIDKKERVQGAEVNATIGQATDYIYLLIDTFNKQMQTYGIACEMKINGSIEEIYLDGEVNEPDANDVEEKDNIKNGD